MNCPHCGKPLLQMFYTATCDSCNPPGSPVVDNRKTTWYYGFILIEKKHGIQYYIANMAKAKVFELEENIKNFYYQDGFVISDKHKIVKVKSTDRIFYSSIDNFTTEYQLVAHKTKFGPTHWVMPA